MATLVSIDVDTGGGGDYSDLETALDTEAQDITLGTGTDEYYEFHCTGGQDTSNPQMLAASAWVTDEGNGNTVLIVNDDDHGGVWDTGSYRIVNGNTHQFNLPGTTLRGLQFEQTYQTNRRTVYLNLTSGGTLTWERGIIRYTGSSITVVRGIQASAGAGEYLHIRTTVIYDFQGSGGGEGLRLSAGGGSEVYAHNCTVVNCDVGLNWEGSVANARVQNCVFYGNDTDVAGSGTWHGDTDYNADSDGSAPGTNSFTVSADPFVNLAGDDFHCDPDEDLFAAGEDLSAYFTVDIDGDTIVNNSIGADDGSAAGGSLPPISRTRRHLHLLVRAVPIVCAASQALAMKYDRAA